MHFNDEELDAIHLELEYIRKRKGLSNEYQKLLVGICDKIKPRNGTHHGVIQPYDLDNKSKDSASGTTKESHG